MGPSSSRPMDATYLSSSVVPSPEILFSSLFTISSTIDESIPAPIGTTDTENRAHFKDPNADDT